MRVRDDEVMTVSEAATRYGLSRKTLLTQVRRGRLAATKSGNVFLVTGGEMERYMREVAGKPGFASPAHPHYGTRPPRREEPVLRVERVEDAPHGERNE